MSSKSIKIPLDQFKDINKNDIIYSDQLSFISKQKEKIYTVVVTKYRFYQKKSSKFGRSHIVASHPLSTLVDLNVGSFEDIYIVYLRFFANEHSHEMDIAFNLYHSAREFIEILGIAVHKISRVLPNVNPNINLDNIFEINVHKIQELSKNRKLVICYELQCDFNNVETNDKIKIGFQQIKIDSLHVRNLFTDDENSRLSIDGENLKVIGETIRNLENSYRKILVENVQISDNAFSDFSYDILCNKNVEKVKMFDCKVNSPNCMNGFYAGLQKYHPNLKSLNISNNNKIGDIGIENLARVIGNCSLESFKFSHCGFTAKGMNILSIALCSKFLLKSIKKLDLSNNNLKKEGSFYLARFIKRTKTLEKLNLSNTEICVGTIVNAIVNRKVSKKSLTDIDLSNCLKMDEADKKALGFYLKNTTKLSRFQMSGIKNNPRSITTIFSSLTKNPDASKGAALNLNLDLSDCAFENTQQPLIPEPIRFITELNLSKCSFKSKQLEQFLVQLENLRCLHTLNLSRCGKNYQGKKTVGECLAVLCHSLPSLQFLSLGSFCDNAKKESLSAFLESLGQNRSILRLDLTGCKLTDEDFAKLGEAISKNNTLRILEFGENKASLKGFTRFLEILNKSENVIGKLPKKDVKQFLKGRGKEEDKLKLKLAADESDNRFDNNIKLVVGESVNKRKNSFDMLEMSTRTHSNSALEQPRGKQFGVDIFDLFGTTKLPNLNARIPTVVIRMADYLFKTKGHLKEGIFRIAPEQTECAIVMKQLDEGTFTHCEDVHCVANCMKVWFRSLPQPLINQTLLELIAEREEKETFEDVLTKGLEEPNLSLLQWLLKFLSKVAKHEKVNRMSAKNLAIVFSPNLVEVIKVEAISASGSVTSFLEESICNLMKRKKSVLEDE